MFCICWPLDGVCVHTWGRHKRVHAWLGRHTWPLCAHRATHHTRMPAFSLCKQRKQTRCRRCNNPQLRVWHTDVSRATATTLSPAGRPAGWLQARQGPPAAAAAAAGPVPGGVSKSMAPAVSAGRPVKAGVASRPSVTVGEPDTLPSSEGGGNGKVPACMLPNAQWFTIGQTLVCGCALQSVRVCVPILCNCMCKCE